MKNFQNSFVTSNSWQGNVSDVVAQNEQIQLRTNAQKLEEKKFDYLKEKDQRDWYEKFVKENTAEFEPINVGDADINSFVITGVNKAMDESMQILEKVRQKKDTAQDRARLLALRNTANNFKQMVAPYGEIIKGLNDGTIHDDPALRSYLRNLSQQTPEFDEKGNLTIRLSDENGASRTVGFNDMMKGIDGFGLQRKVDVFKQASEAAKNFKPEEIVSHKGYEDTRSKKLNEGFVRDFTFSLLYNNADRTQLKDGAKSYLLGKGFDIKNPTPEMFEALVQLEDELFDYTINQTERVDETKLDRVAQTRDRAQKETERHNKQTEAVAWKNAKTSEKNADTARAKADHEISKDSANISTFEPDSASYKSTKKKFQGKAFGDKKKPIQVGTLNINNKTYLQDTKAYSMSYDINGNAWVDLDHEVIDEYGNKSRKREAVKVSKHTEDQIANSMGYTSEDLRSINNVKVKDNNDPLGIL